MARTKIPSKIIKVNLPTIERSKDYNGGIIAKMSDGTIQAIITIETGKGVWDEYRETVENRSEGEEFIDACIMMNSVKKKSVRTKGIPMKKERSLEPSGPHAGYMKNPPTDCQKRCIDKDKVYWVDVYFCAYKCEKRITCPCAAILTEGAKRRIKHDC